MKKHFLLLILLLIPVSFIFGQRKNPPPVFVANDPPPPDNREDRNSLFLSLGLANLLHPSNPSLDIGLEYHPFSALSLEFIYGMKSFRTGAFRDLIGTELLDLKSHHKFWGNIKFFLGNNGVHHSIRRIRPRLPTAPIMFLALEAYHARANNVLRNEFAYTITQRLEYIEAEYQKRVWGGGIRIGAVWKLGKRFRLSCSSGGGILFFSRKYIFLNPIIRPRNFGDIFIGPYHDRNAGREDAAQLLFRFRLTYKIY